MWPYWVLFFIPSFWVVTRLEPVHCTVLSVRQERWPESWRLVFIVLVLMVGLRHEVGADWITYLELLESYTNSALADNFRFQDPAFVLFNWVATWTGTGVYLINLLSAIFFSWGLVVFCRDQPRPWLTLVVAVPYLVTVVAMGYTRQGVAIGIAMVAMVALGEGRTIRFVMLIAFAALFHKSAIILVPMAILASAKRRVITLVWVSMASLILFVLLLQESLNFLIYGYVESQYQSSGASIRIAMNALPAALFLIFRKRFQLSAEQRSFWTWMAWSAMLFIALLIVSPSSTAVDRLALYWIPLQLFVLPRLPNALGKRDGENAVWVYTVMTYSAAVHFVWLVYADTAFAWLPYQFYPWVWLWQ